MIYHQSLIKRLPERELLDVHLTCCAMRGKQWKAFEHYMFNHPPIAIYSYHLLVLKELSGMKQFGDRWVWPDYRGKGMKNWSLFEVYGVTSEDQISEVYQKYHFSRNPIFPEHTKWELDEQILLLGFNGINLKQVAE